MNQRQPMESARSKMKFAYNRTIQQYEFHACIGMDSSGMDAPKKFAAK